MDWLAVAPEPLTSVLLAVIAQCDAELVHQTTITRGNATAVDAGADPHAGVLIERLGRGQGTLLAAGLDDRAAERLIRGDQNSMLRCLTRSARDISTWPKP